jgi:hypothetical protein
VQLGGERGVVQEVHPGDVIIIPAGVAHKNLGPTADFGVVGAYPEGQDWDINYGRPGERPRADNNAFDLLSGRKKALAGPERARQGVSTGHSANYAAAAGVGLLFFWCSSMNSLLIPRPSTAGRCMMEVLSAGLEQCRS